MTRAALLLSVTIAATAGLQGEETAAQFIKRHEGCKLEPYRDGKGWSIGYGHWYRTRPMRITQDRAEQLFAEDYARAWMGSYTVCPHQHPPQVRKALVSLTYQLGPTGLLKFADMLVALESRDYETAAAELLDSKLASQTPDRARECAELIRSAK